MARLETWYYSFFSIDRYTEWCMNNMPLCIIDQISFNQYSTLLTRDLELVYLTKRKKEEKKYISENSIIFGSSRKIYG